MVIVCADRLWFGRIASLWEGNLSFPSETLTLSRYSDFFCVARVGVKNNEPVMYLHAHVKESSIEFMAGDMTSLTKAWLLIQ